MAGVSMSILKSASQQLGSLLVEEGKFLYGLSDKLKKLKLDLEWLQCFMHDADKQQHESQLIRIWISQIKDFAYEAEDIIEKYTVRVAHPRKEGIWNTIKWSSCALCDAKDLHAIGSDITALSLQMSDLSSRLRLCGVKAIPKDSLHITSTRLVDPRRSKAQIQENDIIIGLDKDALTLIHQLINTDKNVVVISGMGGLGKTTLARKVYNDQSVKAHFNTRVWIYVSQEFQAIDIFKEILRKLWDDDVEKRKTIFHLGDDELTEKICEALTEKSCILVLDDVWNLKSWDRLKIALLLPSNSISKLLVTTRNHELQEHVDVNGYLHKQEPLNPDDSWNLLTAIASQGEYDIDNEMKSLGEMMLKKSQYLPLAIVAIGGILKSKSTTAQWRVILDNIHSIFTITSGEGTRMLEVLEMSYNDLPLFLRPCFLYLASFPEDYRISAEKLYHLWEVEGLISTESNNHVSRFERVITLDDIAEIYLEELISRSMVQVDRRNYKGKIKSCRMHDLMRDMCIQKATDEGFFSILSIVKEHGEDPSISATDPKINGRLRRLAVHMNNTEITRDTMNKDIQNSKNLRSILLFQDGDTESSKHILKSSSKNCHLLRVVDLEDAEIVMLPKEIKNLIHLKYLSLRFTGVAKLPLSIVKFQCLETLDLRVSVIMTIPNLLWKLRMLKHLYLPDNHQVSNPLFKSSEPLRLYTLSHLETLKNFNLEISKVEDLFKLKSLTRVTLSPDYFISRSEAKNLKLLLSVPNIALGLLAKPMRIEIRGKFLSEESVDELLQLQGYKFSVGSLYILGKMSMSLQAIQIAFLDLTKIRFFNTEFEIDPMPLLERLPKLSKLILGFYSYLGNKMICSAGGFPELIYLRLDLLENLEEWTVEEGAMPKLQSVVILDCRSLKQLHGMLPDTVHITGAHWEIVSTNQNNNEEGIQE